MKIGILGAGTWGTALAALLVRNGHDVTLWSAIPTEIDALKETKVHKNLPGAILPDELKYTKSIAEACDSPLIIYVGPSEFIRSTAREAAPYVKEGCVLVSAAKGIEPKTLKTMTEIIDDEMKDRGISYTLAALSGPTHAEEVAIGQPTSIVAASTDEEASLMIAKVFSNSCMRVYTNTDVMGVEIAGALKNIIAIASGINRGLGFGDNSQAMLITRGIAEITRMGLAMGCKRRTFMGLAGIGDLIVTCTSRHSRNNRCGELIGKGKTYEEAKAEIGMVIEGYYALEATMQLSRKLEIEMPITEAVYRVIKDGESVKDAMLSLMNRTIKSELD